VQLCGKGDALGGRRVDGEAAVFICAHGVAQHSRSFELLSV
jgi:hypothetical protein